MSVRFDGTAYFNEIVASQITLPANSVGDDQVQAAAAIQADKLYHLTRGTHAEDSTETSASKSVIVGTTDAAATLRSVQAAVTNPAAGDATVSIKIQVDGGDMLASDLVIDSNVAANTPVRASLQNTSVASDKAIVAVITASAGTGTLPKGLMVEVTWESATPV